MTHQAQDDLLRKLRISVAAARTHLPAPLPGLFALSDPVRMQEPAAVAEHLFEGCGLIYRHFGANNRLAIAHDLARITQPRGLTLLIGNDPELAKTVGADGVHWSEASIEQAPEWRGSFKVMTGAAHNQAAITMAQDCGLDAVLVSAVFASSSPSAGAPLGPAKLRDWAQATSLPVYGLGGVTSENMSEIQDFAGLAMIGGLAPLQDRAPNDQD